MTPVFHIAFYRFVRLPDAPALIAPLQSACAGLVGSILIAEEGINGMLAGSADQLDALRRAFDQDAVLSPYFAGMTYKRTACRRLPFKRLKVRLRPEIVPLGIAGVDARATGIDVAPADWRELIQRDDVVVIDNRNHFEFALGRFRHAIDPNVDNFRDFAEFIARQLPSWQAEGKSIAMYCTGGIRCEKTSAWMRGLGLDVYQLQGGILNYFMQIDDAERDFEGECFVFDERIALDTDLNETGRTLSEVEALAREPMTLTDPLKP